MALPTTSNTTRPRSLGYDVKIEDNYFQLALGAGTPGRVMTDAVRFAAPDTSRNPEDADKDRASKSFSQVMFTGGEGLDFAHRPGLTDFDQTRFWSSNSIEVAFGKGEPQYLRLTHDLTQIASNSSSDESGWGNSLVTDGDALFVIDNTNDRVEVVSTPLGTPSSANEDPHAGEGNQNIIALAEMGGEVYASIRVNGIHKRSTAGAWSAWSASVAEAIWGLEGRIVGAVGSALTEFDSLGMGTTIATLPGDDEWTCATEGGHAVLVGASNGTVYAFASTAGALELKAETPFFGESISGIAARGGRVVIGTMTDTDTLGASVTGRLYVADLTPSYTLGNVQLLREWDVNSNFKGPHRMVASRDTVYFALSTAGAAFEAWCLNLATGGLFHCATETGGGANAAGLTVIGETFALADLNRDVLLYDPDLYVAQGWLISPLFDHFTDQSKVWAAAQTFIKSAPANTNVKMYVSTDPDAIEDSTHGSWTLVDTWTSVDNAERLLSATTSRWLTVKLELNTSDTSATPEARGFAVRAYPGPTDKVLDLPINTSDHVERPGRRRIRVPGYGDDVYAWFADKEGTSVTVELLPTGETFEGTIEQVSTPLAGRSKRGSWTTVTMVRFRGRRAS